MIRINLLPEKRSSAARRAVASGGQTWVAALLGVVLLELLALFLVSRSRSEELARVQRKNQEVQASIDDIKHQIENRDAVKAQLAELRAREEAIQKLKAARTGPTAVLLELAHLLTPGRMPTVDREKLEQLRRDNPAAVPNAAWHARRLWLTAYDELDRTVRISGLARDGEDVSEFLRRLALSAYFEDVRMLPAGKIVDEKTHLELLRFDVSAKVKY